MKQQIEYGYARMGTRDKEATMQIAALREVGISYENLFVDQASEKGRYRQLTGCLKRGDVVVVKSLWQLGYSYRELLGEWQLLTDTLGAHVRVIDMSLLDTGAEIKNADSSFTAKLVLQFLQCAAQHEHIHIRSRQTEGIAYAKLQGKHLGRPRISKPLKFDEMYDRWRAGDISADEAMTRLNLKRSTFERFVKERKEELKKELDQKAS